MSEMEDKLGAILNNPQMMQQIMSMAQAMGANQRKCQNHIQNSFQYGGKLGDIVCGKYACKKNDHTGDQCNPERII